jgi:hypothetical protein
LVRHLEGKDISQKTMKEALKEWITFYEEYYPDHMKDIKYLTSWSWIRNKDFRKFYEKITWEESKANKTREWTEKIGGKFIKHENEDDKSENDRFIKMKWVEKANRTKKLEEIKNRIRNEKWITDNPTKKQTENLIKERNEKENEPKINRIHIARALYGPIPSNICIIPIEKLEKL